MSYFGEILFENSIELAFLENKIKTISAALYDKINGKLDYCLDSG